MPTLNNIVFCDNQYLEASMITASSEESGYPIENIVDPIRSRIYKPTSNAFTLTIDRIYKPTSNAFTLTIDLGVNASIDFVGMVGPISDYFGISDAATITLEANSINDFTTPPYSVSITPELTGIFKFLDGNTDYRYWKWTIDDTGNPEDVNIGYIYMGDYTQLADRTVSKGFSTTMVDPTKSTTSMDGTVYYDEKQKYHKFQGLSLGYIPADDRRSLEKLYWDNGKSTPMFVSLDPNLSFSEEYGELTKLVVWENAPSVTHHFDDVYSMSISLRESI